MTEIIWDLKTGLEMTVILMYSLAIHEQGIFSLLLNSLFFYEVFVAFLIYIFIYFAKFIPKYFTEYPSIQPFYVNVIGILF